jgi:AcrR family transcriptional regulator
MRIKEQAIMLAAASLFQRYGFHRVSVEEICRYASVSKATFYKYFKGKDALIQRFLRIVFDDFIKRSRAVLASKLSLKQKFDRIIIMKLNFVSDLGEEILRSLYRYPAAQAVYTEISQSSMQVFKEFVLQEQEQGKIDPEMNIDLFIALMTEIGQMFADGRLEKFCPDFSELVSQVNRLLVYGMLRRGDDQ